MMNGQYYFYLKNGMTLTADAIDVKYNTLFLYAERMVANNSIIACVADIPVIKFRNSFRYIETVVKNNMFIKHYEEV